MKMPYNLTSVVVNGENMNRLSLVSKEGKKGFFDFHFRQESVLNKIPDSSPTFQLPCVIAGDKLNAKGKIVKHYSIVPVTEDSPLSIILKEGQNIYANELLYDNLPCKLYIDLDLKKGPSVSQEVYDTYRISDMIRVTLTVIDAAAKVFIPNSSLCDDVIKLVSMQDSKLPKKSAHLIFPNIVFSRRAAAQTFMCHALFIAQQTDILNSEDKQLFFSCVDPGVYSKNRVFRLPYQSKWGQTNVLRPMKGDSCGKHWTSYLVGIYDTKGIKNTFDEEAVFQKYEDESKILINLKSKKEKNSNNKKKENTNAEGSRTLHEIDHRIFRLLKDYPDKPEIDFSEFDDSLSCFIECIPNYGCGQCWDVWWAVGQALKNIAIDDQVNNPLLQTANPRFYELWMKWSAKSQKFSHSDCDDLWRNMQVRKGDVPKYKIRFLQSIAQYYYGDECVTQFQKGFYINQLFETVSIANDVFDNVDIYNSPRDINNKTQGGYCKPYDLDEYRYIVSQAPMGSGKTYQIMKVLGTKKYKRILVLSPRQTFSHEKYAEFKKICPDFMHYQDPDIEGNLSAIDKLVIQLESLARFPDCESENAFLNYDLVIMDEIESILFQLSSTTNSNALKVFETLMQILFRAKHTIMADAFITRRTLNLCQDIKTYNERLAKIYEDSDVSFKIPLFKFDKNEYNPNSDITATIVGCAWSPFTVQLVKEEFVFSIQKKLKKGENVCVITASKAFLEEIVYVCKSFGLQDDQICAYHSLCDDEAVEALQNVENIWGNPRVRLVIYTTKITVGINFTVKNKFHTIFIYGSIHCPNIRDLMQAHFRIRHTIRKEVIIAINCAGGEERFYTRRDAVFKNASKYMQKLSNLSKKIQSPEPRRFGQFLEKYEQNTYNTILSYNHMEEVLGTVCYFELFTKLLQTIGYKIQDVSHQRRQAQKNRKLVALNPKTIIPLNYPVNYAVDKLKNDDEVISLMRQKKASNASQIQKEALEACLFYRLIIKNNVILDEDEIEKFFEDHFVVPDNLENSEEEAENINTSIEDQNERGQVLHLDCEYVIQLKTRMSLLNLSYTDICETEMYYQYLRLPTERQFFVNVVEEIKKLKKRRKHPNLEIVVPEVKRSALMLEHICKIVPLIGLDFSFDTSKKILDIDIVKFMEYVKKNPSLEEIFQIRRSKDFDKKRCVTILKGVIKKWNGCDVQVVEQERQMVNYERSRFYTCQIIYKDVKLLGLFYLFNTLVKEKALAEEEVRKLKEQNKQNNAVLSCLKKECLKLSNK